MEPVRHHADARGDRPLTEEEFQAQIHDSLATALDTLAGAPDDLRVQMETVPVDSPEVVEALLRGLACEEYRGALDCIDALANSKVEHARVAKAMSDLLDEGGPKKLDHVCMAIHYHLRDKATATLDALAREAQRLVDEMEKDADYRFQWPVRALVTLASHCKGAERERAHAILAALLAASDVAPQWKQERLRELRDEGPRARDVASPFQAGRAERRAQRHAESSREAAPRIRTATQAGEAPLCGSGRRR